MKQKIIYWAALLSNVCLLFFGASLFFESYGPERWLVALLFLPPVLSLVALWRGPDLEERKLRKRVKKAQLRQELNSLAAFDAP